MDDCPYCGEQIDVDQICHEEAMDSEGHFHCPKCNHPINITEQVEYYYQAEAI